MKFLTKHELKELTGYSSSSKAKEVLTRQGIGFVTDAQGRIKTTPEAVNAALINTKETQVYEPNFNNFK
ncbi:MAG: DUF4224 domain-containing protein [Opitutaceae bacterium]|nr:DUF4224 domain-containing protein [Opitutaceae bacterium]